MEGGERCVGTASGMGAILATCMALLKAGDHIVSLARDLRHHGRAASTTLLAKFGVADELRAARRLRGVGGGHPPDTRILFLETPSNPLTEIADIARLAGIAHEHGALLVVDNCFCTPALQTPLPLGADLVIHSATKYLDGQGRCVGGAVIGTKAVAARRVQLLRTAGPA